VRHATLQKVLPRSDSEDAAVDMRLPEAEGVEKLAKTIKYINKLIGDRERRSAFVN
jgi:hypothetical protein